PDRAGRHLRPRLPADSGGAALPRDATAAEDPPRGDDREIMAANLHPAPRFASNEGVKETLGAALGDMLLASKEEHGEIVLGVERERIEDALRLLRDEHDYQQLMEIAGVDYPQREERFEVVYMLLRLTKNHRVLRKARDPRHSPH